ncbi:hypothetical protein Tco_1326227 [Tanacetum coccineum]
MPKGMKKKLIREERDPKDDHDIDNLNNDLVRDNAPYYASEEEERYDEGRCLAWMSLLDLCEVYLPRPDYLCLSIPL